MVFESQFKRELEEMIGLVHRSMLEKVNDAMKILTTDDLCKVEEWNFANVKEALVAMLELEIEEYKCPREYHEARSWVRNKNRIKRKLNEKGLAK